MRSRHPTIVKGLLLLSVLGVYICANGANVTRRQTGKQESEELAQAIQLSNAAVKLYNAEKYKDALNPAKQALEIREKRLSADDERVVASVGNLAAIHLALNNYKEAEVYYKRLLAADEKRFGSETLQVAKTLDVLAWLHYARGDRSQAEAGYKRVLAIKEKIAGTESKEVAPVLFRLAEFYQSHGELEKAVPLYQRLMKFDDEVMLAAGITVRDARHNFACLLRKMKKPDLAADVVPRGQGKGTGQSEGVGSITGSPVMEGVLNGGILNGKALSLPKPEYPAQARAGRVSGTVVVQVTISEEGRVIRACAVQGHEFFWQVTERAASAAEFAPMELRGKPVRVTGVITYNFISQ